MLEVRVRYFASLKETAGKDAETVRGEFATPIELYHQLRERHGFGLDCADVRVAINGAYASDTTPLAPADEVVFIPPVAGG